MYCSSCGKKITENSKFCKYCGASQIKIESKEENTNKKDYKTVWTCDFCKKEFKSKEESDNHELSCLKNPNRRKSFFKNKSDRAWFYLWIITMLVFFVSLFINDKFDDYGINLFKSELLNGLFFFNILVGINAFVAIIVTSIKKNNKVSFFARNILIISLVYFFINTSIFAVEGFKAKNDEGYKNKYYVEITPTPIPTIEVKLTPTAIPKKTTVKPIQKAVDTDPIIDCVSNAPNCNGSSIKLRKSQCSNITCCQIGSSWSVYSSSEKCKEAQNKNNNYSNPTPYPTHIIIPTSSYTVPTSRPIPTAYVAPTSTYKSPPTSVPPTSIPTPTINQAKIEAEIKNLIDICITNCARSGEQAKTDYRIIARANGGYSEYEMSKIDTMINRCINDCKN